MKKILTVLAALLVCGVVYAAQKTSFTQREVRDPRRLAVHLEDNASDAQTRIAALEAGALSGDLSIAGTMTAVSTNGASTNTIITVDAEMDGAHIKAESVTASALDPTIVTNVLADGMTLPAVNGAAVTNIAGGNIASGDIALARVSAGLPAYDVAGFTNGILDAARVPFDAPGAIGGTTPAAGSFSTVDASGAVTANSGLTIISGAYTGVFNIVSTTLTFVVNGSITNVIDADITTP